MTKKHVNRPHSKSCVPRDNFSNVYALRVGKDALHCAGAKIVRIQME
jgi:hypothetical protein